MNRKVYLATHWRKKYSLSWIIRKFAI